MENELSLSWDKPLLQAEEMLKQTLIVTSSMMKYNLDNLNESCDEVTGLKVNLLISEYKEKLYSSLSFIRYDMFEFIKGVSKIRGFDVKIEGNPFQKTAKINKQAFQIAVKNRVEELKHSSWYNLDFEEKLEKIEEYFLYIFGSAISIGKDKNGRDIWSKELHFMNYKRKRYNFTKELYSDCNFKDNEVFSLKDVIKSSLFIGDIYNILNIYVDIMIKDLNDWAFSYIHVFTMTEDSHKLYVKKLQNVYDYMTVCAEYFDGMLFVLEKQGGEEKMLDNDFEDLKKSLEEVKAIEKGELKPPVVHTVDEKGEVKTITNSEEN